MLTQLHCHSGALSAHPPCHPQKHSPPAAALECWPGLLPTGTHIPLTCALPQSCISTQVQILPLPMVYSFYYYFVSIHLCIFQCRGNTILHDKYCCFLQNPANKLFNKSSPKSVRTLLGISNQDGSHGGRLCELQYEASLRQSWGGLACKCELHYEASLRQIPVAARSPGRADACALQALQPSCGDCEQSFDPQTQPQSPPCMHRDTIGDTETCSNFWVQWVVHSIHLCLTCSSVVISSQANPPRYLHAIWNT